MLPRAPWPRGDRPCGETGEWRDSVAVADAEVDAGKRSALLLPELVRCRTSLAFSSSSVRGDGAEIRAPELGRTPAPPAAAAEPGRDAEPTGRGEIAASALAAAGDEARYDPAPGLAERERAAAGEASPAAAAPGPSPGKPGGGLAAPVMAKRCTCAEAAAAARAEADRGTIVAAVATAARSDGEAARCRSSNGEPAASSSKLRDAAAAAADDEAPSDRGTGDRACRC